MDFRNRVVLDAQTEGLACVYCGRSCREGGSLVPLRSSARQAGVGHLRGFVTIGWLSLGRRVIRCDPPCQQAQIAIDALRPDPLYRGPA